MMNPSQQLTVVLKHRLGVGIVAVRLMGDFSVIGGGDLGLLITWEAVIVFIFPEPLTVHAQHNDLRRTPQINISRSVQYLLA